jgi:putative PIN family toxin of toxin-antitoxin system
VVIDTQVFLRATINRASLPAKINFDYHHLFVMAVSPQTRAELVDVLSRPKLRMHFPKLTDETMAYTLSILDQGLAIELTTIPSVSRDPKDDPFLATAIASGAKFLVSEDQDLLVLNPYKDVQIIDVEAFYYVLKAIDEGVSMSTIPLGAQGSAQVTVTEAHTAQTMGSGSLPVFATPAMIALMEAAAVNALASHLNADETSVGIALSITHTAATGLGAEVQASAEVVSVEGRQIGFQVVAQDSNRIIGEGTHQRVVVNRQRFMQKVESNT